MSATVRGSRRLRHDAEANRGRILTAAVDALAGDPDVTVGEIALAAGVSRATVYRHFPTRPDLLRAARSHSAVAGDHDEHERLRPAGQLGGRGPAPLDVVDVLNKVPPHQLGEQVVSEAQRLAGVRTVAIYLVDIDGTRLLRLAGAPEFPEEIPVSLAVGPEIPREGLVALRADLEERLPGSTVAPMMLRGRAIGVLLAVDAPEGALLDLARQAGAAIALADTYTDVFDAARRHKETSPAAEVQQNQLPPRLARISGGTLAGNVLPGYEIGGDWFDYVENPDGAWLATADAMGSGTLAAAIGAVCLGAFRAKRRRSAPLGEAVLGMEEAVLALGLPDATCSTVVARWHGPTASLFWIACGDRQPLLIRGDGSVDPLPGTTHPPLGRPPADGRVTTADSHRLKPDERLLLVSDGLLDRCDREGIPLGLEAVRGALGGLRSPSAALIVRALEDHIRVSSDEDLEDDVTLVAFSPSSAA